MNEKGIIIKTVKVLMGSEKKQGRLNLKRGLGTVPLEAASAIILRTDVGLVGRTMKIIGLATTPCITGIVETGVPIPAFG
ncbi:MAG TPA: hypothetical protein VK469_11420, partial [Candidatus Kapabacteria bacterium]|nr:hypothetical protein [Candidatus Kapabacteria bacterium]